MAGTTTILVVELTSPTSMVTRRDDEVSAATPAALLRIRNLVEHHDGRIAKSLGDGVVALFDSSYAAARAAVALQQTIERDSRQAAAPVALRIGANIGEVLEPGRGDDTEGTFASAVVATHRVCSRAQPGEILVSELVRRLVGERTDVAFEPSRPLELEGSSEPFEVASLRWEPLPERTATRVIVADDAALVRSGIVRLLADEGFEVIAEAADAEALLEHVEADPPDLVVTDIRMPPTHRDEGLRAAATIRARHPSVAVLVLSQYVEAGAAADLFDDNVAGVGYLLKERVGDLDEFIDACRSIAAGGRVVDPLVSEQLLARREHGDDLSRLSPREREVLALMAQGKSNAAIAAELFMSPKTVESHVRAIFTKLDLAESSDEHRRVAAVIRWLQQTR